MPSPNNAAAEQPYCVCLALCNEIIEDARSHNKTLVSLFNGIGAVQLPTLYPRMNIMASVSGAAAGTSIRVVVQTPSGNELVRAEGQTNADSAQSVTDFPIELQGVVLPEAGLYAISLYAADTLLAKRHFNVFLNPQMPPSATAA